MSEEERDPARRLAAAELWHHLEQMGEDARMVRLEKMLDALQHFIHCPRTHDRYRDLMERNDPDRDVWDHRARMRRHEEMIGHRIDYEITRSLPGWDPGFAPRLESEED